MGYVIIRSLALEVKHGPLYRVKPQYMAAL